MLKRIERAVERLEGTQAPLGNVQRRLARLDPESRRRAETLLGQLPIGRALPGARAELEHVMAGWEDANLGFLVETLGPELLTLDDAALAVEASRLGVA